LNSGDVFGLLTAKALDIWAGKGSSADEKALAATVFKGFQGTRPTVNIAEGHEPAEFWDALGGKTEYAEAREAVEGQREPRLFQCSNVTGSFVTTEAFNFIQDDLINDDVMILDLFTENFCLDWKRLSKGGKGQSHASCS